MGEIILIGMCIGVLVGVYALLSPDFGSLLDATLSANRDAAESEGSR